MDLSRVRGLVFHLIAAVAIVSLCVAELPICSRTANAQTNSSGATPLTLHVYENLMQFPVVVLSSERLQMPPVAPDRFSVSLDSGPRFHPTHVRKEGDDPISLSILIDLRPGQGGLVKNIGDTVAELGRGPLKGKDRLSIYLADECRTRRVLYDLEPDISSLGARVDAAMADFRKSAQRSSAADRCDQKQALWNALAFVVDQASSLTGRRVILAWSDNADGHSRLTWIKVKSLATRAGVAIFDLRAGPLPSFSFVAPPDGPEDHFQSLCELTGGLAFTATEKSLDGRLSEFVALLRNRYIVEFPRPNDAKAGEYSIRVSVEKLSGFIRPAGLSVPIADPKILDDPNTIMSDPLLSPPTGARRAVPLAPH